MIINIPMWDDLDDMARRLFFKVWFDLEDMLWDFEQTFQTNEETEIDSYAAEAWPEYLATCRPDLQMAAALLQQSLELALKARICKVSPFLLILRSDAKFPSTPGDMDFATLKTLDAIELPNAVNTLTDTRVSAAFMDMYSALRVQRNMYIHMGLVGDKDTPGSLLRTLAVIYSEVWPEDAILKDYLFYRGSTRTTHFYDGKNSTMERDALYAARRLFDLLKPAEFKALFGVQKKQRRYLCESCIHTARFDRWGEDVTPYKTAYLVKGGGALTCLICQNEVPVERLGCITEHCKGNVFSKMPFASLSSAAEPKTNWYCHTCGEEHFRISDGPLTAYMSKSSD
jgi:hypothetical protein